MEYVKRGRWNYVVALCSQCQTVSKEVRIDQWKSKKCKWICLPCAKKETYTQRPNVKEKLSRAKTKHGESKNKNSKGHWLYGRWQKMKRRCKEYPTYVAKNIQVCEEWKNNYVEFKQWAEANNAAQSLELDRINNFGDYCPENCRWVTHKVNCQNR
jgi:hypothetical protein